MPTDEVMAEGFRQFIADRYDALVNLDLVKFKAYMRKYGEGDTIRTMNDQTLIASMHYARINLDTMPEEEKEKSRQWLKDHGLRLHPGFP